MKSPLSYSPSHQGSAKTAAKKRVISEAPPIELGNRAIKSSISNVTFIKETWGREGGVWREGGGA